LRSLLLDARDLPRRFRLRAVAKVRVPAAPFADEEGELASLIGNDKPLVPVQKLIKE
jgi:hypothetical protein